MKSVLFILFLFFLTSCSPIIKKMGYKEKKQEESNYKEYNGKTILDVFKSENTVMIIFTDGTMINFKIKN